MSHHCHIAIIENGKASYFDSYWGAVGLHLDLLGGPSTFRSIVVLGKHIEAVYPDVAEAAACLDMDRKELLWYSIDIDDVLKRLTLRQIFVDLLQPAWEGWSLQWADEGPVEIARRLKLPLDEVAPSLCTKVLAPPEAWTPDAPESDAWRQSLISVRWDDGLLKHYQFRTVADRLLLNGPVWAERLRGAPACEFPRETIDPDWTHHPWSGAFLDWTTKSLAHWAHDTPAWSFIKSLDGAWPDWSTSVHTSGLIRQAQLAGLDVEALRLPRTEGFRIVLEWLNKEDPRPGLQDSLQRLIERLRSGDIPPPNCEN